MAMVFLYVRSHSDNVYPWYGPHSMYNGLSPYYMSASEISTYWSTQNNANISPTVNPIPDVNTSDGNTVERSVWEDGDNCVRVEELKVTGGCQ